MLPSVKSFHASKASIVATLAAQSGPDKSKKGDLDAPIVPLIHFVNSLPPFVTTSSCSGRVAVFTETKGAEKKSGHWVYVSHERPKEDDVVDSVRQVVGLGGAQDATFKFEPFILHVQCRSLPDAKRLTQLGLASGFKNTGMVIGKKILVALRCTLKLEVPVVVAGELVVSDAYLRHITAIALGMFDENEARVQRLFDNLKALKEEREGEGGLGWDAPHDDKHDDEHNEDNGHP